MSRRLSWWDLWSIGCGRYGSDKYLRIQVVSLGVVKHGSSSRSHLCHVEGDGWCQLKRRDSGVRESDSNPDSDI